MTIITVCGGKGGTGKSTIAVNIAVLLSSLSSKKKVLLVDLDVDNPCTYTLLDMTLRESSEIASFKPEISSNKCTLCGECVNYCPTHALVLLPNKLLYISTLCEGCAACLYVCPYRAISEGSKVIGWIKEAKGKKLDLIVGEVRPGERKSEEVMERTLKYALMKVADYEYVILDAPPGTGRGIYEALKIADIVLLVTEPTKLGLHDLKRMYQLVNRLDKPRLLVINKYGLKGGIYDELEDFINQNEIPSIKIPYDRYLLNAYIQGNVLIEVYPDAPSTKALIKLTEKIKEIIQERA